MMASRDFDASLVDENLPSRITLSNVIRLNPLSTRYNLTFIEAIIRDPLWVYVYWEISIADKEKYEKQHDFSGFYLHIPEKQDSPEFSLKITGRDDSWYIAAPAGQEKITIGLCACLHNNMKTIASTEELILPRLLTKQAARASAQESALSKLSGVEDLPVLRSGERASRSPWRII